MPSRQPRWPSIGLVSCNASARWRIAGTSLPVSRAISPNSASVFGRNSWSGGSRRRIVTGNPFMMRNISAKSSRWIGSNSASAARRPASSSAMISCRIAPIRSASKNMCSVRLSPMPSAPNRRAARASIAVSALARTLRRRIASAQLINMAKSPDSSGWIVGTSPTITSPVDPSIVMMSPAFTKVARADIVRAS